MISNLETALQQGSDLTSIWRLAKSLESFILDVEQTEVGVDLLKLHCPASDVWPQFDRLVQCLHVDPLPLRKSDSLHSGGGSLIDEKNIRTINLGDALPMDVAVCHNVNGYYYADHPLPTPCLYLKTRGDHVQLLRYDLEGRPYGAMLIRFPNVNIQCVCISDVQQRVFLSDARNRVVHVMRLDGEILQQIQHVNKLIFPSGLTVDERPDRMQLFVCDAQRSEIFIFSLLNYNLVQTIFDPVLHCDICYPSVNMVTNQLYITNLESNNILVFDLADHCFVKTIPDDDSGLIDDLIYPWGLVHDSSGRAYTSSFHKITEISTDGKIVKSVGEEGTDESGFKSPLGMAISTLTGSMNLIVCDTENCRLKIYRLF